MCIPVALRQPLMHHKLCIYIPVGTIKTVFNKEIARLAELCWQFSYVLKTVNLQRLTTKKSDLNS